MPEQPDREPTPDDEPRGSDSPTEPIPHDPDPSDQPAAAGDPTNVDRPGDRPLDTDLPTAAGGSTDPTFSGDAGLRPEPSAAHATSSPESAPDEPGPGASVRDDERLGAAAEVPAGSAPASGGAGGGAGSGPAGDERWSGEEREAAMASNAPGGRDDRPSRGGTVRRLTPWVGGAAIALAVVGGIGLVRAAADDDEDGRNGDRPDFGSDDGFPGPDEDGRGRFPGPDEDGPGGFPGAPGQVGRGDHFTVMGTVDSVDGDTIEVEGPDGDTLTITITDDTEIQEVTDEDATDATTDDIEQGDEILATGTRSDDDETLEATDIRFGDLDHPTGMAPGGPLDHMPPFPHEDNDNNDENDNEDTGT